MSPYWRPLFNSAKKKKKKKLIIIIIINTCITYARIYKIGLSLSNTRLSIKTMPLCDEELGVPGAVQTLNKA